MAIKHLNDTAAEVSQHKGSILYVAGSDFNSTDDANVIAKIKEKGVSDTNVFFRGNQSLNSNDGPSEVFTESVCSTLKSKDIEMYQVANNHSKVVLFKGITEKSGKEKHLLFLGSDNMLDTSYVKDEMALEINNEKLFDIFYNDYKIFIDNK